jgi:hypothetical protein
VEAIGVALARSRREISAARQQFADAEVAEILLVLGERGRKNGRTCDAALLHELRVQSSTSLANTTRRWRSLCGG